MTMSCVKSDESIVQSEVIKRAKGGTVRHFTRFVLVGILVGLSMSAPNAVGQEKDKPVLEQLLDLLLQRGQINREQYNTLQEQARKEQSTGAVSYTHLTLPTIYSV